jgi:hypothetical protein
VLIPVDPAENPIADRQPQSGGEERRELTSTGSREAAELVLGHVFRDKNFIS